MNKARRKWLQSVINALEEQKGELESIQDEEQEAYDNLPESLNDTDRANDMYENIDGLGDAASELDDIISNLQEILER